MGGNAQGKARLGAVVAVGARVAVHEQPRATRDSPRTSDRDMQHHAP
eukprot:COSAG02_NODE_63464_length_263_cov_0.628049_1_plen_46_part_10